MKTKKNITLIGMPAVGKSTVGNLLAKKIGFDFLDTDDLIQSKEQKTLSLPGERVLKKIIFSQVPGVGFTTWP